MFTPLGMEIIIIIIIVHAVLYHHKVVASEALEIPDIYY